MSGGHWNYEDDRLKNEIFGYDEEIKNPLGDIELSAMLLDMLKLLHEYDWYVSGDTGRERWDEARTNFKKRWLKGDRKEMLTKLVNERIDDLKIEILDSIK